MKTSEIVARARAELVVPRTRITRITTLPARQAHPVRVWLRDLFALPVTESYLSAGERCVIRTRRHWLVPLLAISRGGGMMSIVGVLTFLAPQVFLVQLALWLGAVAHTGYIGVCVLRWRAEQVAVTDRRIIRVSGLVTLRVDAVALSQITDSTLRRTIPGRILGYGTVRIETAGQADSLGTMTYVPSPDALYRATLEEPRGAA